MKHTDHSKTLEREARSSRQLTNVRANPGTDLLIITRRKKSVRLAQLMYVIPKGD
jgi:hypothetical protein